MKKKVLALGLALVMCMPLSVTAYAASSSTTSNSGNQTQTTQSAKETPKPVAEVVNATPAGGTVKPENVVLVIPGGDGTVGTTTLGDVVESKRHEVKAVVTAVVTAATAQTANAAQVQASVNGMLTGTASPQFTATVVALAEMKGGSMVVNNMGSVKTAAVAKDALGNTIASAGVVRYVTGGSLVMLMSINVDGSIEYVEGVVDPVTGAVMGAFQGTPAIITVLVLA